MIRELRAYDPKPGCRFGQGERVDAIVPDVFVASRGVGWAIELNSATLPKLLVNRSYYTELSGGAQDKQSKAWLSERSEEHTSELQSLMRISYDVFCLKKKKNKKNIKREI